MLVRYFMTKDVEALSEDQCCLEVYKLFRRGSFRRAPVTREGKVVGIVSDRDLGRAISWDLEGGWKIDEARSRDLFVRDVMCADVLTVSPKDHLEDVARLMLEKKVGGFPVVDKGNLVGIITDSDIFKVFVRLSEQTRGIRITFQVSSAEEKGVDPVGLCLKEGASLRRLTRYESPAGSTVLTAHLTGSTVRKVPERLTAAGCTLIEVADIATDG